MAGNLKAIMFNRTKFKLEEADFFLSKMGKNQKRATRFLYYTDAFISAAYSSVNSIEKEIKQLKRQKHKEFQGNCFEKIYELRNHVLIMRVRHPSQHEGVLPVNANRPTGFPIPQSGEAWTVSFKVINRRTPGTVIYDGSTAGIGNVIINVLNNVQLVLPEMRLIGDEKEIPRLEIEQETSWTFVPDDEGQVDVLDACKSYLNSIETFVSEMEKEAIEKDRFFFG